MQQPAIFSTKDWIKTNMISADRLEPDTLAALESFTLMWNLFEGLVCDNSATMSRLEKLAAEIVARRRCQGELESILNWFKSRYCNDSGFAPEFEALHLRPTDRRELIESVLRADSAQYQSQVLVLLIIVYRIYNNLFLNLKSLEPLNRDVPVFVMASRALATIIEAQGRHFKRERYTENV